MRHIHDWVGDIVKEKKSYKNQNILEKLSNRNLFHSKENNFRRRSIEEESLNTRLSMYQRQHQHSITINDNGPVERSTDDSNEPLLNHEQRDQSSSFYQREV